MATTMLDVYRSPAKMTEDERYLFDLNANGQTPRALLGVHLHKIKGS
jgi:hypothetical protein